MQAHLIQTMNDMTRAKNTFDEKARVANMAFLQHEDDLTLYTHSDLGANVRITVDGKNFIQWSVNHYSGLNRHPAIIQAGIDAFKTFGCGCGSSAYANGNTSLHRSLERKMASFVNYEACVLFTTGYTSMVGLLTSVCGKNDLILSDGEMHNCGVIGSRLCSADVKSFKHNDSRDLERILQELPKDKYTDTWVLLETVHSLIGDECDIKKFCNLRQKYGFKIIMDDAHSFGIYGEGKGLVHELGLTNEVDILVVTMSKSLVSCGGLVCCNASTRDYIRSSADTYFFQAGPTPATVATALKALDIISQNHEDIINRLRETSQYFRHRLNQEGFTMMAPQSKSGVVSIDIADGFPENSQALFKKFGCLCAVGEYPVTKKDVKIARFIVTALHTTTDVDDTMEILKRIRNFVARL